MKTVHDVGSMSCIMMMPGMHGPWWEGCPAYICAWAVMMAAMMLPATAPIVLLVARTAGTQRAPLPGLLSVFFVTGYCIIWVVLGIPAYFGTLYAQTFAQHNEFIAQITPQIGAGAIILAGVYQFTGLKQKCLNHCRTPLHFVMHGWRKGLAGAMHMGLEHGIVCAGCCIGLMLVLFAVGIMNMVGMIVVAALMSAEKLLPWGRLISSVVGIFLVCLGIYTLRS